MLHLSSLHAQAAALRRQDARRGRRLQVCAVAGRPHQGGAGGRRPVRRDDEHNPAHRGRAGQEHGGRRAAARGGERRGGDGDACQAAAAGARREKLRANRADERGVRALCLCALGGHGQEGRRLRQGEEAAGGGERRDCEVRPRRQGHWQALAARGALQHVRHRVPRGQDAARRARRGARAAHARRHRQLVRRRQHRDLQQVPGDVRPVGPPPLD